MTASADTGGLWLDERPLVLASASAARFSLLVGAGIPVERRAAAIDERSVERAHLSPDAGAAEAAKVLATEKALAVSREHPGRLVLGADQTLSCDGHRFSKPVDRAAAREQLRALSGRTHVLSSALALVRDGTPLWRHVEPAHLTMRKLGEDVLERYLGAAGDKVLSSVGAYQLEGLGIHLMEKVEGDQPTILGLPLLPFLAAARRLGLVAA
jgi:septum formation protein